MLPNVRRNIAVQLTAGGTNPLTASLQAGAAGNKVGNVIQLSIVGKGGAGGYSYTLISGSLPAGVTGPNASTGLFSGTPTAAGTFEVVLKVTDSALTTYQQIFTIVIAHRMTATAASPTPPLYLFLYAGYQFVTTGQTGAVTYSAATGLPTGLAISAGGLLTGTVTSGSTLTPYACTVTATDGGSGDVIVISFTMQLIADLSTSFFVSPIQFYADIDQTFSVQLSNTDAAINLNNPYTVTANTLPAWLSIDSLTPDGLITFGGIPPGTSFPLSTNILSFTVTIQDKFGMSTVVTFLGFVRNSQIPIQPKRGGVAVASAGARNYDFNGIGASRLTNDGTSVAVTLGSTMNKPDVNCTLPADTTAVVYGNLTRPSGVFITFEAGAFMVVL